MARRQAAATSWAQRLKAELSKNSEHREGVEPSSPQYGCGVFASGPPALDYRVVSVGMVGLEPTMPCARNTRACRYPTSRLSPVRTVGFEPRCQASPCSVSDRARADRSGLGGARILVSGSSDRRSTVSATNPNKKPDVACGTGFSCMFRYFGGRVSQTPVAQRDRIRRLTDGMSLAFPFATKTRPQDHHLWYLLLKATAPSPG